MKSNVHIFPLKVPHHTRLHCCRCDKEFHSSDLLCGMTLDDLILKWYCPTDDCHGTLESGIYTITITT